MSFYFSNLILQFALFIFFITFISLKIVLLILGFKTNYDQDIFISLLLSISLVDLFAIFVAQLTNMNRVLLSMSTSTIEVVVFLLLFYSNTKDIKATKLLFYGKLLLLLMNIGSLVMVILNQNERGIPMEICSKYIKK